MARVKQTARLSTGGRAPRAELAMKAARVHARVSTVQSEKPRAVSALRRRKNFHTDPDCDLEGIVEEMALIEEMRSDGLEKTVLGFIKSCPGWCEEKIVQAVSDGVWAAADCEEYATKEETFALEVIKVAWDPEDGVSMFRIHGGTRKDSRCSRIRLVSLV